MVHMCPPLMPLSPPTVRALGSIPRTALLDDETLRLASAIVGLLVAGPPQESESKGADDDGSDDGTTTDTDDDDDDQEAKGATPDDGGSVEDLTRASEAAAMAAESAVEVQRNMDPAWLSAIRHTRSLYLPTDARTMEAASELLCYDAPWLPTSSAAYLGKRFVHESIPIAAALLLGAKSMRAAMVETAAATRVLRCPGVASVLGLINEYKSVRHVLVDVLEVAEAAGARSCSVLWDFRTHGGRSILQPRLARLQGPALVFRLSGVRWSQEDVVRAITPYIGSQGDKVIGGSGGDAKATGKVESGPGLCSVFQITDCLQILTGQHLYFLDPASQYVYVCICVNLCEPVCGCGVVRTLGGVSLDEIARTGTSMIRTTWEGCARRHPLVKMAWRWPTAWMQKTLARRKVGSRIKWRPSRACQVILCSRRPE